MRWTEDDVKAFETRKGAATVRTHLIEPKAAQATKRGGRNGKYGNVKTEADGMTFDSKREARRWMTLRMEELAGTIQKLERQVVYPLVVNGLHICDYRADHVYERDGAVVVEDSKGYRTQEFKLKAKLMMACHGIAVVES
jgi:hypothetical protein